MRIVAGRFRGRTLARVGKGGIGPPLRPTADRVREGIFSMLESRGAVHGARVLDLFSGSGAFGLEALSRSAVYVCFVESGQVARNLIRTNVTRLGVGIETRILGCGATRLPSCSGPPFDLVFLDPPYGKDLGIRALVSACERGWVAPKATVVLEEGGSVVVPEGFSLLQRRRYSDTHVLLMEAVL